MVRNESLDFFNPAIVEVISSSGITLSTTVTFFTHEQSKNTSWIRDLAASLSSDWNTMMRGGNAADENNILVIFRLEIWIWGEPDPWG